MRNLTLFITTLIFLVGCITNDTSEVFQSKVVVEKSKLKSPQWINRAPARLYSDDDAFRSINYQQDILNLPYAIRDAQTEAIELNKNLVLKELRAQMMAIAKQNSVELKSTFAFENDTRNLLDKLHREKSKVEDIYYEKVLDKSVQPETTSYRVFILLSFPKTAAIAYRADLKKKWSRSKQADLKKLSLKL